MVTENSSIQGIVVPLDLAELKMISQSLQPDGSIEAHVRATTDRTTCPSCKKACVKIHDIRGMNKKRYLPKNASDTSFHLETTFSLHRVSTNITETDSVCGKYKRTTKRFRENIAKKACQQPIARIAEQTDVGPRFVQECFETLIEEQFAKEGRTANEVAKLPTPCFLGIDEFARRKGHHYDPILCDLVNHTVLEISEGRKMEEVQKLLERLDSPETVKAVSMDMSASFRPAVQLCLPEAQIVVDHFHVIQYVMKAFKKIVSS